MDAFNIMLKMNDNNQVSTKHTEFYNTFNSTVLQTMLSQSKKEKKNTFTCKPTSRQI